MGTAKALGRTDRVGAWRPRRRRSRLHLTAGRRSFDAQASSPPAAHSVLLSGGDNTTGRSPLDAGRTAPLAFGVQLTSRCA
ncbi:hypothetical protein [Spirillospora sp. CA-294931]|uniref:hypothetical protein n=1 Tax=Spirillospora sp. CA-294931 TaxID=3240042 RepID=UPI003D942134